MWCMMDEISGKSWGDQRDKSFSGLRPEQFGVWSLFVLVAWMEGWGMKCVNEWRGKRAILPLFRALPPSCLRTRRECPAVQVMTQQAHSTLHRAGRTPNSPNQSPSRPPHLFLGCLPSAVLSAVCIASTACGNCVCGIITPF